MAKKSQKGSADPELRIFCNECAHETSHDRIRNPYEITSPGGITITWQLVECRGCQDVSVYREHITELVEDLVSVVTEVHPVRQFARAQEFNDASPTLRRIYEETIGAYNNSFLRLCAAGLRALVEGICDDQKVMNGPIPNNKQGKRSNRLESRIEGLAEKNILTSAQAQALHEHRIFGNKSLHESAEHHRETLKKLIAIVESVLFSLYSLPDETEQLRRKRDTKVSS